MDRQFYLDLAAKRLRMPIGADLVLRERADHAAIQLDGKRLAEVLLVAADRYRTPLVFPVMDLMLEKSALLSAIGVAGNVDSYHFSTSPTDDQFAMLEASMSKPLPARMTANAAAISAVARAAGRVAVGMSIGPVSLMTKLLADPITAIYIAGTGVSAEEDDEVRTLERTLALATQMVLRSVKAQIEAGARAVFIAEPAANKAYFSPNQLGDMGAGTVWDRYVMTSNRKVKALLESHGVDLLFHCCGELVDPMVKAFASLDPAVLSLGSSRRLWQDAALVPRKTVLFGNLPTKKFFSDDAITPAQVATLTGELAGNMSKSGHPFILGSECDILHVPGCEQIIRRKVDVMLTCKAGA